MSWLLMSGRRLRRCLSILPSCVWRSWCVRDGTALQVFYVVENDHLARLTTEALFHADHATGTGQSDLSAVSTMAAR